jgi:Zn-dependent protease with chaperone function
VTRGALIAVLAALLAASTACAGPTTSRPPPPSDAGRTGSTTTTRVDPPQAARLQRIMVLLIRNAANAGGNRFFVTTGLLQTANDDRLRAILAHELSHQDLNHVARAQILGVGLDIGAAFLDQIFPGTGAITPLAGRLVTSTYSRGDEYAADAHGVVLLRRAGYSKDMMTDALTWLMQVSGTDSGGFFATHSGTADRTEAVRKMP